MDVSTTCLPLARRRSDGSIHPTPVPRRRPCRRILVGSLLIAALLGAMPGSSWAWGRLGHRAAGRVAESRLTPRARAAVRELLDPGESLADASTWADEHARGIRGSSAWHYVNVPISEPRYNASFCGRGGCVVEKIAEFRRVLADRNAPRARRRQALRFLVHLVQDLHQPLHVGDDNDRGGNELQLHLGRRETTNLHQVWDSGLFRWHYREHAEDELVRDASSRADRPEARAWADGRVEDWADESLALARRAYQNPRTGRMLRRGDEIGLDYVDANGPKAVERVAQSGVRLAAILNEILGE